MPAPRISLPAGFPTRVKAIATDLDRTLIGEDYELHERTIAAIAAARAAGIHVVIVTGRMFRSVRRYCERGGTRRSRRLLPGRRRRRSGQRALPPPRDDPARAGARGDRRRSSSEGFGLNCYVDDNLYVSEMTSEARRYADFQQIPIETVGDLLTWLRQATDEAGRHRRSRGSRRARRAAARALRRRASTSPSRCPSSSSWRAREVSKGSGLGFAPSGSASRPPRHVAFGDGENDIELLEWAGYARRGRKRRRQGARPRRLRLPARERRGSRADDRGHAREPASARGRSQPLAVLRPVDLRP